MDAAGDHADVDAPEHDGEHVAENAQSNGHNGVETEPLANGGPPEPVKEFAHASEQHGESDEAEEDEDEEESGSEEVRRVLGDAEHRLVPAAWSAWLLFAHYFALL